jgi:hypothetical protein
MKVKQFFCVSFLLVAAYTVCGQDSTFRKAVLGLSINSNPYDLTGPQQDSGMAPLFLRTVTFTGNKRTKDKIVEREIAVLEGKLYAPKEFYRLLRLTKEQLMNTTLFVTVDIMVDTLLPDEVDVKILLRERWYLFPTPHFKLADRNINVWLNEFKGSLDRTEYGMKVVHNNLTGRNDKMNLYFIGGYTQQISVNYYQPFFDKKLRQGFGFGYNRSRQREVNYATDSNRQQFFSLPDFVRRTTRAEIMYSYRKGSQMRSSLKVIYGKEEADTAVIALNPKIFGDGRSTAEYVDVLANYQYLNLDYIPYPLRGWMVDVYALQRFSASIPMLQIGGKGQGTWSFAPKTYINFQSAVAWTLGRREQPFYNSRMLGYRSLYMQGLEMYVADGNLAGVLRTTLRRQLLSFSLQNIIRSKSHSEIPFRIFVKTYGNLGYAHHPNPGNNFINNQLLRTGGFGIDIAMVYDMVLKLEYSFNQFGGSGFFIHTATDF